MNIRIFYAVNVEKRKNDEKFSHENFLLDFEQRYIMALVIKMTKNIMMAALLLASLLLGVGTFQLMKVIARRVESKLAACAYSCILGIALVLAISVLAYFVIPEVSHRITYVIGGTNI